MTALEKVLGKLLVACKNCHSYDETAEKVQEIVGIDKDHELFDILVTKLCNRFGIVTAQNNTELCVKELTEWINGAEKSGLLRAFTDAADAQLLAECIVKKGRVAKISMNWFRDTCQNCGYVISPRMKTTTQVTSILKKYQINI